MDMAAQPQQFMAMSSKVRFQMLATNEGACCPCSYAVIVF